ncbi:helix-turn-helix transcriptional regulator [Paenibacillus sp. FSL W8-0426]|uniref:helix-turn-helix domain-containing protein n=1 Tax=Paenibacillus sp. FSL W8-0426 TaxID=2921714 RepID=UPI0030D79A55
MVTDTTIRAYIGDFIKMNKLKLQQLAELTGLNAGTISGIVNGNRPIAISQIDALTEAMELPKGHFYEQYAHEFFVEYEPHWRRIEPFLLRCAELNKLDLIRKVVYGVTEKRVYLTDLFELAEQIRANGMGSAALIIYQCIAEGEKYQYSERLALCQYRIFLLSQGLEQKENLRLASVFEQYVDRLDEEDQLDGIKDLMNTYAACSQYDKWYESTFKLENKSKMVRRFLKNKNDYKSVYPPFVYEAYAYLVRGGYYDKVGDYDKALSCAKHYYDLTLFDNPTDEELVHVRKLRKWSHMNTLLYKVLQGDETKVCEYLEAIPDEDKELCIALLNIFQAANKYDYDTDFVMEQYRQTIDRLFSKSLSTTHLFYNIDKVTFFYELAHYQLRKDRFDEGMKFLLKSFEDSICIRDELRTLKCVDLFGEYRNHATVQQMEEYKRLFQTVCERKKYGTN